MLLVGSSPGLMIGQLQSGSIKFRQLLTLISITNPLNVFRFSSSVLFLGLSLFMILPLRFSSVTITIF